MHKARLTRQVARERRTNPRTAVVTPIAGSENAVPIRALRWLPELVSRYSMHCALPMCGHAQREASIAGSESAVPIRVHGGGYLS